MNQLELANQKRDEILKKLDKVKGTPREEEFKLQLDKIEALIKHLEEQ